MRRVLRWLRRLVLGALALVVLVVAIALGALHTSWGRNLVREEVVAALQADFPGTTIAALDGSPLGTLVLRGVSLGARDGKPLVTIERLEVSAALRPLLDRRVVVEAVRAQGVVVSVREQPPAPPRPPPAAQGTASASPGWSIELPAIVVERAHVVIAGESGDERLEDVALDASVWIPARAPLRAVVHATGRWRGEPLTAFALAAVEDDVIQVPAASVTLERARVAGFGLTIAPAPLAVTGELVAHVPAPFAQRLGGVALPGDVEVAAELGPQGTIALTGRTATATLDVRAVADLVALRAHAVIVADAPDLATLTPSDAGGRVVTGAGTLVATLDADVTGARGMLAARAAVAGVPPGSAVAAIDATPARLELAAAAHTPGINDLVGVARGAIVATVARRGEGWELTSSTVAARARDITDVRGAFALDASAQGRLWPAPALAVRGSASGRTLRQRDVRAGDVRVTFTGDAGLTGATLATDVAAREIVSGTVRVPAADLAARIDARADGTARLELGRHRVRTADGATWTGAGGRVDIEPTRVTIDRVRTGTAQSRITASARVGLVDDALEARVRATDVALALAAPALRGELDGDVTIARTRGRWRGAGRVSARGVATEGVPPVDGELDLKVAGRRIELTGHAGNPALGRGELALAVIGPADITDARGWRRLPRAAVEQARITLAGLDTRPLGGTARGDGVLSIARGDVDGELHVRDIETSAGVAEAHLTLAPAGPAAIAAHATAQLTGLPPAAADATITLPARPFDPGAWLALGRGALREATVRVPDIAIEPTLLARLGVDQPYRAHADLTLVADAGARTTTLRANVRELTGPALTAPVDVVVDASTGPRGTTGTARANSGALALSLDASSPLTIADVLAGTRIASAPIAATLRLPTTPARQLLRLFGETEVVGGDLGGTVTLAGTIGRPTVRAELFAKRFAVAATRTSRTPPTLEHLALDARWDGDHVEVDLQGNEAGNRLLKISARGRPDRLKSVTASIEAANFELAPLAAFAPGALRAARGTLHAALTIRGLDPQTGDVRGMLQLKDFRLPLSPELGTLRRTSVELMVVKQSITGTIDARLGAGNGTVKGTVVAQLQGGMPMSARLDVKVDKVAPIGALQPQISAHVTGTFTNQGERWVGSVGVQDGKVYVPPEVGNELLLAGAPSDMIFIDANTKITRKQRRPPTRPWLITQVAIGKTEVDVEDANFNVRVTARGKLRVEVGDGVGIHGMLTTDTGAVDVLGRRYRLDHGLLEFDGTTDPRLDIRLIRDFKNLTLTVDIAGRSSDPAPRMSGDPAIYSEGQLLSFFLGAEPGADDSQMQANQAAVSSGLSILSSRVGQRINKYLPVKLGFSYEAGTGTSSGALRVNLGQLSKRSYVSWRQRLEARPDENPGEMVLEYQLRKNALIEAIVGERAQGADLLLRTRW